MALGAAIIGGIAQASAAKKAAKAQTNAANADIAFQRETRDMIIDRVDPFYQPGIQAQNALSYEMGLAAKPEGYAGFQATPGYQFQLDQGNNSINALAGARGGLNSGRTLQDLATFNQGIANQEYGNYYNRLAGLASQGLSAAGLQANAATNAAQGTSNALSNVGNAQAAGAVGVGNAISGTINNGLSLWQYQRGVNSGSNSLFGGNSWG